MFSDTLDNIKFICKDLWAACWDKQVDNLRTNHRVRFVLSSPLCRPIYRMSYVPRGYTFCKTTSSSLYPEYHHTTVHRKRYVELEQYVARQTNHLRKTLST